MRSERPEPVVQKIDGVLQPYTWGQTDVDVWAIFDPDCVVIAEARTAETARMMCACINDRVIALSRD